MPKRKTVKEEPHCSHEDMNELSFYERPPWHPPDVILDQLNESGVSQPDRPIQLWAVENVVKLLDSECTVPFIARYRKEQTNNMEAAVIREIKSLQDELKVVQEKTKSHLDQLAKQEKLTAELRESFCEARSLLELEQVFAPFKSGSKTTLAERAKKAGLEPAANMLLGEQSRFFNVKNFVKRDVEGCKSAADVEKGIQHIIANIIAKDKETRDQLRTILKSVKHMIHLSVTKARKKDKNDNKVDYQKYKTYIDSKHSMKSIKPHQVLAINRGEEQNALSVKVVLPDKLSEQFVSWCKTNWSPGTPSSPYAKRVISASVEDANTRLISPSIVREIRSSLTKSAERASMDVFAQNLHRLLLTPPVKGRVILGVDPGFRNGCKLAVVSQTGDILYTDVSYMHTCNTFIEREKLANIIMTFKCETIAIGNGTACRQTEEFFTRIIQSGVLRPLDVMYCIVNESGASIYSVSPEAEKEMPNLDPNLRSAVSIARRLQDPLAELVKIEPKHIGVGMYQHDVSEKLLKVALSGVVEECVSFVGVDLNICSEVLLKCVAGITPTLAKKITSHRQEIGGFTNRQQLLDVKGIGPKTFKQCAGFVRITPTAGATSPPCIIISDSEDVDDNSDYRVRKRKASSRAGPSKKRKTSDSRPEPLDATWIHPESYEETKQLLKMANASSDDIGSQEICTKLTRLLQTQNKSKLSKRLAVGEATLQLILDGLRQSLNYDIRAECEKPLFRKGVASLNDISCGTHLTGRVTNVVHFGAFIDIGIGQDGLCHTSKMPASVLRGRVLGPGDRVEVRVGSKTVVSARKVNISLQLIKIH